MNIAAVLVTSQLQLFKIKLVIGISAEYLAAIIASHDHMLRLAGDGFHRAGSSVTDFFQPFPSIGFE